MSRVKIPPIAILLSGLIVVSLLTALGGILHYGNDISNNSEISIEDTLKEQKTELAEKTTAASKKTSGSNDYSSGSSNGSYGNSTNSPQQQAPSSATAGRTGSPSSTQGSNVSYVKVFLSVNGSPKGDVTLKSGSNHCQVLSQAYATGLISSLDMRYNSQYKTYGVYVIDGIGDPSSVWWVYKVNGQSPPGCSYMKVHGGDSVNWQYLKN
jgi:hypothetical protein